MDASTRYYINELAQRIIKAYQIQIPIDNLEEVVQRMGGIIVEQADLDPQYNGSIKKDGDSSFRIAISNQQSAYRKNFTIAHELGHLFLHMGFKTNPALWEKQETAEYRRFDYLAAPDAYAIDREYQANEFAAALLMPKDQYEQVWKESITDGRPDVSKIAQRFNVSHSAAINRGKFLGYFAWV